jgi:pyruvate, water dikinase
MEDIRHIDTTPEEQGGKALGLNILRDMGYQVPEYFVVPFNKDVDDPEIVNRVNDFVTAFGRVALRSSANIEDGANFSFAGQFDSFLNVTPEHIPDRIIDVRKSVELDNVKAYCEATGISYDDIRMNVIVQSFEEPISGGVWMGSGLSSGRLEWTEGRGDAVVDGTVKPNHESYDESGTLVTMNSELVLRDQSGKSVAEVCKEIQLKLGYNVDLEFCITEKGIQWLQLRKVTKAIGEQSPVEVVDAEKKVIQGEAASPYVASGKSYRLDQERGAGWTSGKILIARATSPADMMYIMTAEGVVTRMGGMLSHSAVVCRELGKACVVGVDIEKIQNDVGISIDGKQGKVYLQ